MQSIIDFYFQHYHLMIFGLDLLALFLSNWYVGNRLNKRCYKHYRSFEYKLMVFIAILGLQEIAFAQFANDTYRILIYSALTIYYLFIGLVDMSIRIVGNDTLLIGFSLIFLFRISQHPISYQIKFIGLSILVYCLLIISLKLLDKLFKSSNSFGMGDVKLLMLTAYISGPECFILILLSILFILGIFLLFQIVLGQFNPKQTIAFAPFISLAVCFVSSFCNIV